MNIPTGAKWEFLFSFFILFLSFSFLLYILFSGLSFLPLILSFLLSFLPFFLEDQITRINIAIVTFYQLHNFLPLESNAPYGAKYYFIGSLMVVLKICKCVMYNVFICIIVVLW